MSTTEFEFIKRSCPSIVKMWVLLEGSPDPEQLKADIDHFENLDDFKQVLIDEFDNELKDIKKRNIVLLHNNKPLKPNEGVQTLANTATAENPLVVRYPISDANIKVTFFYGLKQGKLEIPHTSGSFDKLETSAKEIFEDLEDGIIYFVNDGTEIWNAYNFNTVVKSQTAQDNTVVLKLKVLIKGRKKYSDWKLKDVFNDILRKPNYDSLSDMPRFDISEFPPLDPPFNESELTQFVEELKKRLIVFQEEFGNEQKNRVYINVFMIHAVYYIRTKINESVILDTERKLSGSHGYGPTDYWVKFIEILLILCEAKADDMNQGVAQVVVQMQSGIEQINKQGQKDEKLIYGIVTTGKLWRFVRWSGSSEDSEVHISREYTCNFQGEMESEKEILTYITQIAKAQVYFYDKNGERPLKRVKVNEK